MATMAEIVERPRQRRAARDPRLRLWLPGVCGPGEVVRDVRAGGGAECCCQAHTNEVCFLDPPCRLPSCRRSSSALQQPTTHTQSPFATATSDGGLKSTGLCGRRGTRSSRRSGSGPSSPFATATSLKLVAKQQTWTSCGSALCAFVTNTPFAPCLALVSEGASLGGDCAHPGSSWSTCTCRSDARSMFSRHVGEGWRVYVNNRLTRYRAWLCAPGYYG